MSDDQPETLPDGFTGTMPFVAWCGYGVPPDTCNADGVVHLQVTNDPAAVVDAGTDVMLIIERCEHIFACARHAANVRDVFRWSVAHAVVPPCPLAESRWEDDGCVMPEDERELTTSTAVPVDNLTA